MQLIGQAAQVLPLTMCSENSGENKYIYSSSHQKLVRQFLFNYETYVCFVAFHLSAHWFAIKWPEEKDTSCGSSGEMIHL